MSGNKPKDPQPAASAAANTPPPAEPAKPAAETPPAEAAPAEVKPPEVEAPAAPADAAKPEPKPVEADPAAANPDSKEGEAAPPENKTEGEAKPAGDDDVVPDKYELAIPENSHLSSASVDEISALAKELKLTNKQAQQLLEREHRAGQAGVEATLKNAQAKSDEWLSMAKADKEIGGDKLPETVQLANDALSKMFDDATIKEVMDKTGFGNHPSVLKGFARIGRLLADDKIHRPSNQPPPKTSSRLERLYDHPTSKQK